MKRSEINGYIRNAESFFAEHRFILPPFGRWTPEQWKSVGPEADEVRHKALGWDLTDFGEGQFEHRGLLLFTIRNGDLDDEADGKCYAEKIMIVRDRQITPWHFHWSKVEDIINRGGGNLVIELAWATGDENGLEDREVEVACDGVVRRVPARGRITLGPGESVTLPPKLYHSFYGEAGKGTVLVGEVSKTNDDNTDNRFLDPIGRFPSIEEDEAPYRLLCTEYPGCKT
ncbi:MAG: D-lyxose/D-mannose family sugar isomerase [Phycisphaeraceae bacterium]|nr:D-lyxose/D-mannose family sugar isomerase [Phycisphaeraceae bacterium]